VSARGGIQEENIAAVAVGSADEIGSFGVSRLRLRSSKGSLRRALRQTITIRSAPRTVDDLSPVKFVSVAVNSASIVGAES